MAAPADPPPGSTARDESARSPVERPDPPPGEETARAPPPGEDADPHCLSPADADRLLAAAPWRRFAVLGEGMAAKEGDDVAGYQDTGWGERVAAALARRNPELAYADHSERSQSIADVCATQLGPALDFRPDLALLVAGGSDILRRDFERCTDVLADYDAIVTALQRAGADVVTATIFDVTRSTRLPDPWKPALRRRLDDLAVRVRQVARARGTLHLELAEHPAAELADVYGADLRFLTRRGQAIAAAALIRRLGDHPTEPRREIGPR